MKPLISTQVAQARIARWALEAESITDNPTWTERRLVIEFGGSRYLVGKGQVFQCPHCNTFDLEWSGQEVIEFFKEHLGIKPFEIEITCSVVNS